MILFHGNDRFAYRDPTCCEYNGTYYLFFTVSEKDGRYMYNRIGMSKSKDLRAWSEPVLLTQKDYRLNYCSPGNVIERDGEFILCFNSYPMPFPFAERSAADETARLFTMRTRDFFHFTEPELLNPKTGTPVEEIGRMIDPYILECGDGYRVFFKQNGVSFSQSDDLERWEFLGNTGGGENVCVLKQGDGYLLIHSPQNGIAFSRSKDLSNWEESHCTTLGQNRWEWAEGRITAGFAMEAPERTGHRYVMFFHGSRNVYPETHGNASLAMVYTDDFKVFYDEDGVI